MTRTTRFLIVLLLSSSTMLFGCQSSRQPVAPTITHAAAANHGQVPLSFEANHGQAKEPVQFLARGTNATLYLTSQEAALEVRHSAEKTALMKMKLLGAKEQPRLQGQQELPGKSSYFSGKDASQWKTNIPTYQQVKYEQVYAGIDLVYYGNQQQLEYDFIVQPGADPNAIRFRLEGAKEMTLNEAGDLVLQTTAGEVKQHKPVVYQELNGKRQEIAGNYVMKDGEVSFAVGAYDASQPLVIDPVIAYATFVGGELGGAVFLTADKEGHVYFAMNFGPAATPGAYSNGNGLAILKFNKTGTALLYCVTMGGSEYDRAYGMAADEQGNCYLTGGAASSTFPTTPGAYSSDSGNVCTACRNVFVTKINPTGSNLAYSTFIGSGLAQGLAIDAQGNTYITGYTADPNFPTTPGAFQPKLYTDTNAPSRDTFVTKLNPSGSALVYSTFFGAGDNSDQGKNIAVDAVGNAYVVGMTGNGYNGSLDNRPKAPFPVTPGAYQSSQNVKYGGVFLTKFNTTGTALIYSTIIGAGPGSADPIGLAVDANGNAHVAASTQSLDYPVTPGAFQTTPPDQGFNAYVTKVNATGSGLVYSTYLGGNSGESAEGLSLDPDGNAIITGNTSSSNFPQTNPPVPFSQDRPYGSFVTKLNAAGNALLYSQIIPFVRHRHTAVDSSGNVYIEGLPFPSYQPTAGAYQTTKPYSTSLTKLSLPRSAVTVSAANYSGSPLACEAIVSAFGSGLATATRTAVTTPLPTSLVGTTIKVNDSAGVEREAPLFFVSPTQVNFQIPPGTANGAALITITSSDGTVSQSPTEIVNVAPSLFSADATGRGLAAAHAQRTSSLAFEQVVKFDFTKAQWVALPIDLGPASEQVYLVLYGTGIRLRSSLSNVTATIGGTPATVSYAGAQNDFVGLDQVNVLIPRSLIGKGMADVVLNVEGKLTNTVKVSIK